MVIEVHMPKIGLTMTEGKVIEWTKKVGDRVEKGELLFVFETEKASFDVEAPRSGYLARIVGQKKARVSTPFALSSSMTASRKDSAIRVSPPWPDICCGTRSTRRWCWNCSSPGTVCAATTA